MEVLYKIEARAMARPEHGEVSAVDRKHIADLQSFPHSHKGERMVTREQ